MNIDLYTEYAVHLLRCAVLNEQAKNMPEGIEPEVFLKFCLLHKIENIAYIALKNTDMSGFTEETAKAFKEYYMHAITADASQQYYLEIITDEFEKHGIDYLVLKGRELAKLYPSSDMRQSSDLDIYIGNDNAEKAKEIMLDMGADIEAYSDTNDDHDEYRIDGLLCELHRALIQGTYPWQEECNRITDRLIKDDSSKHCCKMCDEDFYLYNLAHAAKHMKFSGVGIKVFLDLWIILNKYKDRLDWDYLKDKLELCHLTEFEKNAEKLCEYWFEGKTSPEEKIKKMSRYAAVSGWVGTEQQAKSTELAETAGRSSSTKLAKLKKCIDIVFSPYESMAARYPVLEKHKWLTPFCRLHRALSAALFKRELVKNVTGELDKGSMEEGKAILAFKNSIGL